MKIPIAGALTGENREQIPVLNPVTNEQIDTVPCVTKEDIVLEVQFSLVDNFLKNGQ